jgi:hypothetical protein
VGAVAYVNGGIEGGAWESAAHPRANVALSTAMVLNATFEVIARASVVFTTMVGYKCTLAAAAATKPAPFRCRR